MRDAGKEDREEAMQKGNPMRESIAGNGPAAKESKGKSEKLWTKYHSTFHFVT